MWELQQGWPKRILITSFGKTSEYWYLIYETTTVSQQYFLEFNTTPYL